MMILHNLREKITASGQQTFFALIDALTDNCIYMFPIQINSWAYHSNGFGGAYFATVTFCDLIKTVNLPGNIKTTM